MQYKISKKTLLIFYFIFISMFIAYFVSIRGENVDSDYKAYFFIFDNFNLVNVEPTFKILSYVIKFFDLNFSVFLFIFCFFSILLKTYSLISLRESNTLGNEGLIYFLLFYFFCFFALWDLTQIRASLSISFLMISFCVLSPYKKIIFKMLALASHYSISFVLVFELIYFFAKRNVYLHLLFSFIFCIFLYFLIEFTPYAVYDTSNYTESFNPVSFKNLFIISTFIMIFIFCKGKDERFYLIKKLSVLSISLLMMYYIFGLKYPSIAIRVADLSLFFGLLSLTFIRNNSILRLYKYISLIVLAIYFTYVFYFSNVSIIHLDEWGTK